MNTLRFCFDFVSPYSYLAWTQIGAIGARFGREVEPVPVLFGAVLDALGTRGPVEVPARRRYLIRDVARIANRFRVPLVLPPAHPFNPLLALRLASLDLEPEQRVRIVDALLRAAWCNGRSIEDRTVLADVAAESGLPASALDEAQSPDVKARLRKQTEEALAAGLFGVPTVFTGEQMFFGCDSLPHLESFLLRGDVVDAGLVEKWEHLPATASRAKPK
jgi:2-hydroxychromene-2-carboxylate isomerase